MLTFKFARQQWKDSLMATSNHWAFHEWSVQIAVSNRGDASASTVVSSRTNLKLHTDVKRDKAGAVEFKRAYGGGIPLTVAGDETIRGFSAESMLYFLKGSGVVSKNTLIEKDGKP